MRRLGIAGELIGGISDCHRHVASPLCSDRGSWPLLLGRLWPGWERPIRQLFHAIKAFNISSRSTPSTFHRVRGIESLHNSSYYR